VGGILALGEGFPPNLAIIGDEFLKSCEFFFASKNMCSSETDGLSVLFPQGTRYMIIRMEAGLDSHSALITSNIPVSM